MRRDNFSFGDPTGDHGGLEGDAYLVCCAVGTLPDTSVAITEVINEAPLRELIGGTFTAALAEHATRIADGRPALDYYNRAIVNVYAVDAGAATELLLRVRLSRTAGNAGEPLTVLTGVEIPLSPQVAAPFEREGVLPATLLRGIVASNAGTDEDDEILVSVDVTPDQDPGQDVTIVFELYLIPTRVASSAERGRLFLTS